MKYFPRSRQYFDIMKISKIWRRKKPYERVKLKCSRHKFKCHGKNGWLFKKYSIILGMVDNISSCNAESCEPILACSFFPPDIRFCHFIGFGESKSHQTALVSDVYSYFHYFVYSNNCMKRNVARFHFFANGCVSYIDVTFLFSDWTALKINLIFR